jgi:hypothetical protein
LRRLQQQRLGLRVRALAMRDLLAWRLALATWLRQLQQRLPPLLRLISPA